jgi:uncharacterized membrane protein YhaH (DUF805 family)
MKIKKKSKKKSKNMKAAPKPLPVNQNDRMNFFIVIGIILLVNILIYFTAFPKFDDIAAADLKPGSASRASFFKIIVIVVTDIFLFITVSMTLSRRSARHKKQ